MLFLNKTTEELNKNKMFILRIVFSSILLTVITLNSLTNFTVTDEDPKVVLDYTHLYLTSFNNFLKNYSIIKCIIMIFIGLVLDSSVIYLAYAWLKRGESWRPVVIIGMFMIIKFFTDCIFAIKYPADSLWEFSGFPSLLISYKNTNNLFFSGLVGMNLILAVELGRLSLENKKEIDSINYLKIASIVCYSTIFVQIVFDMSIRSHYIIDEFTGIVVAHYCIIDSDYLTSILDKMNSLDEVETETDENENDNDKKYATRTIKLNFDEKIHLSVKMINSGTNTK